MDTSGTHVWLVLWKAFKALEKHDRASILSLGIGGRSDFAVLEILLNKGPMPVSGIGRKLLLTSGSATTAIDRAERNGWVKRRPSTADRRVVEVHLTSAGREIIKEAFAEHQTNLERVAGALSHNERLILVDLLKKLGKGAEATRRAS